MKPWNGWINELKLDEIEPIPMRIIKLDNRMMAIHWHYTWTLTQQDIENPNVSNLVLITRRFVYHNDQRYPITKPEFHVSSNKTTYWLFKTDKPQPWEHP